MWKKLRLRVTILDKLRNEHIRLTHFLHRLGDKAKDETEVVWPCHEER